MEADIRCDGKPIRQTALNDFVVSRGIASRLIELHVRVDGEAADTISLRRIDRQFTHRFHRLFIGGRRRGGVSHGGSFPAHPDLRAHLVQPLAGVAVEFGDFREGRESETDDGSERGRRICDGIKRGR